MKRLQGFPAAFDLTPAGSRAAQMRLLGNAVPPPLAAAVLRAVRLALAPASRRAA